MDGQESWARLDFRRSTAALSTSGGRSAGSLFPDHEQRLVIEPEVLPMSLPDYPGLSAPGSGVRP